jgi:hypothetical protein
VNVLRAIACAAALQLAAGAAHATVVLDPFQGRLTLISTEGSDRISGEIEAVLDYPFDVASAALDQPSQWCDILMLHLNTKGCWPTTDGAGAILQVSIGKKYDQPLNDAYRVDFAYHVLDRTESLLRVSLNATDGPLGTSDYRIILEATPADAGRTSIRLAYSYSYGFVGRIAMSAYLATAGRDKVGFTVVGRAAGGEPRYIGGMRGVVERNTMRYYLAIEAYLGSLSTLPPARTEKSLLAWFTAIERYPRQLHEMERDEYLAMKRREYSRQR